MRVPWTTPLPREPEASRVISYEDDLKSFFGGNPRHTCGPLFRPTMLTVTSVTGSFSSMLTGPWEIKHGVSRAIGQVAEEEISSHSIHFQVIFWL